MIVLGQRLSPTARWVIRALQVLTLAVLPLGLVACGADDTITAPEVSLLEAAAEDARTRLEAVVADGLLSPALARRLQNALNAMAADFRRAVASGRLSAEDARAQYEAAALALIERAVAAHGGRTRSSGQPTE